MEITLLQAVDSKGRKNTKSRGNMAYFCFLKHKTNGNQLTTNNRLQRKKQH